jgi:hypothetical protein
MATLRVVGWWRRAVRLVGGIWAVRRVSTVALLVLLSGVLVTSCTPPPLTLTPALQAQIVALADRLARLPVDPETRQPGATALLAAWRDRVAAPPPSPPDPPLWAPSAPEEVSNVP